MTRRKKTDPLLVVALVMSFLSGAALAFFYAYNQPMCYINFGQVAPQRQFMPLETTIDTGIIPVDGQYHYGKDSAGGRME